MRCHSDRLSLSAFGMYEEEEDGTVADLPQSSSELSKDETTADQKLCPDSSSSSLGKDNPQDVDKIASLLQFASSGNVKGVKKILDSGLDVNDKDYDGRTALHLAASDGHYEVVKLLLERHADVNPRDRFLDTVRDTVFYPSIIYFLHKLDGLVYVTLLVQPAVWLFMAVL
jgi:hypothetical protein